MNQIGKKFGAILMTGGVLVGALVALSAVPTEAATAAAVAGAPDGATGSGSSAHEQRPDQTSTTSGTITTESSEVTSPAEPVPASIQDAVAELTMSAGPDGQSDSKVAHQLDGAGGQITLTNTEYSGYGAFIQSAGYCTGERTGFRVTAEGFEWIRLSIYTGTALVIGEWIPVAQVHNEWLPLPIATPGISYIVDGWDETPYGGDLRTVLTSFTRLPTFNSYWSC